MGMSNCRLRLLVQWTCFPHCDRNPHTFLPNIVEAARGDIRSAMHKVYRSKARASNIVLPVVTRIQP